MAIVLSDFVINDDDDVGIMGDLNFPYANQNLPEHHVEDIDFGLVVDSDTDSAFDSGSFKRRDDLEDGAVENVQNVRGFLEVRPLSLGIMNRSPSTCWTKSILAREV